MKTCSTCQWGKDESEFSFRGGGKRRSSCKECQKEYHKETRKVRLDRQKQYYKENREGITDRVRRNKYGVTPEDFKRMLAEQRGLCAICEDAGSLGIDHDHRSGKVRSLLCSKCNRALGFLNDSWVLADAAAKYLKLHE